MSINHYNTMKIQQQLREIRKGKKGFYLKRVAKDAGISVQHLSNIERGKTNPSIQTLEKISEALGYELRLLKTN